MIDPAIQLFYGALGLPHVYPYVRVDSLHMYLGASEPAFALGMKRFAFLLSIWPSSPLVGLFASPARL